MSTALKTQALTMTEQQFTTQLIGWAKAYGWKAFHVRTSGRMNGHKAIPTVQGDSGFPDLVLVKPPRLIFAELKVGSNKTTEQQDAWLQQLAACGCNVNDIECYVWTPKQWTQVLVQLSRPTHE